MSYASMSSPPGFSIDFTAPEGLLSENQRQDIQSTVNEKAQILYKMMQGESEAGFSDTQIAGNSYSTSLKIPSTNGQVLYLTATADEDGGRLHEFRVSTLETIKHDFGKGSMRRG